MGCCPRQFLRRTELIKKSLWLDDEPKWWCSEPPQFPVKQHGIPVAATPVRGSRFPDRWFVCSLRRRGFPRRTVFDCRAATMALPPGHPKSDANAAGMLAGTPAVTPAVAGTEDSAGGSGILFTLPPPLADLVGEAGRRAQLGANVPLPRRQEDLAGSAEQGQDLVTPLAMADLDTAMSTFRESLLADVSRVIAESPTGSAEDAPRRGPPADTRKSRIKGKAPRHRSPWPSSS